MGSWVGEGRIHVCSRPCEQQPQKQLNERVAMRRFDSTCWKWTWSGSMFSRIFDGIFVAIVILIVWGTGDISSRGWWELVPYNGWLIQIQPVVTYNYSACWRSQLPVGCRSGNETVKLNRHIIRGKREFCGEGRKGRRHSCQIFGTEEIDHPSYWRISYTLRHVFQKWGGRTNTAVWTWNIICDLKKGKQSRTPWETHSRKHKDSPDASPSLGMEAMHVECDCNWGSLTYETSSEDKHKNTTCTTGQHRESFQLASKLPVGTTPLSSLLQDGLVVWPKLATLLSCESQIYRFREVEVIELIESIQPNYPPIPTWQIPDRGLLNPNFRRRDRKNDCWSFHSFTPYFHYLTQTLACFSFGEIPKGVSCGPDNRSQKSFQWFKSTLLIAPIGASVLWRAMWNVEFSFSNQTKLRQAFL